MGGGGAAGSGERTNVSGVASCLKAKSVKVKLK
jgi:hypothetical protein